LNERPAHRVRVEGFWIEPAYPFLESAPRSNVRFIAMRYRAAGSRILTRSRYAPN
jgi:hypothetical protein